MYKKKWIGLSLSGLMVLLSIPTLTFSDSLQSSIEAQVKTDIAAQQSQKNIDNVSDETVQMLAEYREVLRQTESLHAYNEQLNKLVTSQSEEMDAIDLQLKNIEATQRDIVPLMLKMIDTMSLFVELDVPFLPEERQQRVAQLQTLMERADVTLAEKVFATL